MDTKANRASQCTAPGKLWRVVCIPLRASWCLRSLRKVPRQEVSGL